VLYLSLIINNFQFSKYCAYLFNYFKSISKLLQLHINQKVKIKINFPPTPLTKIKASTMASTNVRFTPCDIDLNVEITPLRDLNIVVETSLTNQPIFV